MKSIILSSILITVIILLFFKTCNVSTEISHLEQKRCMLEKELHVNLKEKDSLMKILKLSVDSLNSIN